MAEQLAESLSLESVAALKALHDWVAAGHLVVCSVPDWVAAGSTKVGDLFEVWWVYDPATGATAPAQVCRIVREATFAEFMAHYYPNVRSREWLGGDPGDRRYWVFESD